MSESAMQVESFFDPATCTFTHVVHAGPGSACAIIDPVLDFDQRSGRTSRAGVDKVTGFVEGEALRVQWILETHAHADHLSGARVLSERLGGKVAIGEQIGTVQETFAKVFNLGNSFPVDGSQFDHLFKAGDSFRIGELDARVLHVPGHTPADCAYRVGDAVFIGDTLFMPDVGSARCDFPGGDARQLYQSVRRLLELPEHTRLYLCHDYPPAGRQPMAFTTVGAQRASNIHMHDGVDEKTFVAMRTQRDATLSLPTLILPSLQFNIRAGDPPAPEDNGVRYLKIPLNLL